MDTSSVLDYGLQYQWCTDSDLSSLSSPETLSPIHCMDSSLSPSYQQPPRSASTAADGGYTQSRKSSPFSLSERGRKAGRTARIRSKQRESASEKEKLRMRDLTKALHHLRSYLPPSVAPAGQTLTKIETLRLTIRYISYLSAQLGLSEDALFQRRERGDTSASGPASPDIFYNFQNTANEDQNLTQNLYPAQCYSQSALLHSGDCSFGVDELKRPYDVGLRADGALESPSGSRPSCQMCGNDFCIPLVQREYYC